MIHLHGLPVRLLSADHTQWVTVECIGTGKVRSVPVSSLRSDDPWEVRRALQWCRLLTAMHERGERRKVRA